MRHREAVDPEQVINTALRIEPLLIGFACLVAVSLISLRIRLDVSDGELLVNGKRIDSTPFRREAEWQPDGPGEVRITVIDGAGRVASSEVWVQ